MPSAASVAENCVSAPRSIAACRRDSSSAPVEPELAATADIAESNSANFLTATPSATAMAPPATAALLLRPSKADCLDGEAAAVRSSTDAFAERIPATKLWVFASRTTETTLRPATAHRLSLWCCHD